MQCFRNATYYICVFNLACAGTCECSHMLFPSRRVYIKFKIYDNAECCFLYYLGTVLKDMDGLIVV